MSGTTSSIADKAVKLATSAQELVATAKANPEVMAALQAEFGTQIAAAEKSPWVIMASFAITSLAAKYGFAMDTGLAMILAAAAAVLAGDLSQLVKSKMSKGTAP